VFEVFNLDGKVALVTGGGGLLGTQHGHALAECGARVIITDVAIETAEAVAAALRKTYGEQAAIAMVMDVADEASIHKVHNELERDYGGVQILINNAAIDPKVSNEQGMIETSRLENFPLEQWDSQLRVGLTGAFLCSKVFGQAMSRSGGGVILNIASDLSVIAPDQRLYRKQGLEDDRQPVKPVTYSVIKSGLVGLTKYLATYWADQGVRVNALSPGGVYANQPDDFVMKLSSLIPMGRMARKDEYRAAVQFLCSEASSYMTGQNIIIDGGRSVL